MSIGLFSIWANTPLAQCSGYGCENFSCYVIGTAPFYGYNEEKDQGWLTQQSSMIKEEYLEEYFKEWSAVWNCNTQFQCQVMTSMIAFVALKKEGYDI